MQQNELKIFQLIKETLIELEHSINLCQDKIARYPTADPEMVSMMMDELSSLMASKCRINGARDTLLTRYCKNELEKENLEEIEEDIKKFREEVKRF